MDSAPRRPDIWDEPDDVPDGWTVAGSAGRSTIAPEEVDRAARAYWEAEADAYQAEHGAFLAHFGGGVVDPANVVGGIDGADEGAGFVWGPEGVTEVELGMLGPLGELQGRRVLEVGCGAAQCSAWLAARGVHAVAIDLALNQLRHAPLADGSGASGQAAGPAARPRTGTDMGSSRGSLTAIAATATALPFAGGSFAAAFSAYGAVQFVADLPRLLAEVRRVLAPGGRWVLSVTHPVRWAFPDDPGPAGLTATGSYFDRRPYVERDEAGAAVYAEFHRTLGDYVAGLVAAGFTIEAMVEPEWPDWNEQVWDGWSPERGTRLPGTLIIGCRAGA